MFLKQRTVFLTSFLLDNYKTSVFLFFHFLQVKKKLSQEKKRKSLTVIHNKDCYLFPGSELNKRNEEIAGLDQTQRLVKVDFYFRILFPGMFLLFNLGYWPYWTM